MTNKKSRNLIEEGRVIRWMKLANLAPLSESFVDETFGSKKEELEEAEEVEEVLTKDQARTRGDSDRLNEKDMSYSDDMNDMNSGEEAAPMPPMDDAEGEASGETSSEGNVESFLSAVADALSSFSGVPVDVSSDGESGEGAPEDMDMGSDEGAPEDMDMGSGEGAPEDEEEPVMENKKTIKEETSPVGAKTTSSSMNKPPAPKKTHQADPGKVKDPMKGEVRVKGAEKPTKIEGQADHKYKALEEKLVRRVLERLVRELKESKKSVKR